MFEELAIAVGLHYACLVNGINMEVINNGTIKSQK